VFILKIKIIFCLKRQILFLGVVSVLNSQKALAINPANCIIIWCNIHQIVVFVTLSTHFLQECRIYWGGEITLSNIHYIFI